MNIRTDVHDKVNGWYVFRTYTLCDGTRKIFEVGPRSTERKALDDMNELLRLCGI